MTDDPAVSRRTALRTATSAGLTALAVPLAGCLGGGSSTTVAMTDDLVFEPETLRASPGTTVTWTNDGAVAHTVTAYEERIPNDAAYFASGGFESENAARNAMRDGFVRSGESYEHTFEVSGTYEYFCIPHEGSEMIGTVRVR